MTVARQQAVAAFLLVGVGLAPALRRSSLSRLSSHCCSGPELESTDDEEYPKHDGIDPDHPHQAQQSSTWLNGQEYAQHDREDASHRQRPLQRNGQPCREGGGDLKESCHNGPCRNEIGQRQRRNGRPKKRSAPRRQCQRVLLTAAPTTVRRLRALATRRARPSRRPPGHTHRRATRATSSVNLGHTMAARPNSTASSPRSPRTHQ